VLASRSIVTSVIKRDQTHTPSHFRCEVGFVYYMPELLRKYYYFLYENERIELLVTCGRTGQEERPEAPWPDIPSPGTTGCVHESMAFCTEVLHG
jgi:hypothetical protein